MTTDTHVHETVGAHEHVAVVYEDDDALSVRVAAWLAEAIEAGGAGVAIATGAHREAIAAALGVRLDVADARGRGALFPLDAGATLRRFTAGGRLDRAAFRRVLGGVLRAAAETGGPVRAFGEMVALLWDRGDVLGAIALEEAWNDLARDHDFSLLCGYRDSSVAGDEHAEALGHVCRLHSAVLHDAGAKTLAVSGRFAGAGGPKQARRLVADALRRWGLNGRLLDDAELVVSELATNAIRHARSGFSVAVRRTGSGVRLAVRDASSAEPEVRRVPGDPTGRGMLIVAALATRWGVEATPDGKTVWVELRA